MSLGRRATLLVVGCVARTAFAAAPCGFRDYFERSVKKDDNGIHKWLHYGAGCSCPGDPSPPPFPPFH